MATAYKATYSAFESSEIVYVDYDSTDWDRRNWNTNLVCTPGTEIVSNRYDVEKHGATEITVHYGFHAQSELTPCPNPRQPQLSAPESFFRGLMRVVVLDYTSAQAVSGIHLMLLRANVIDELDETDLAAYTVYP